MLTDQRLLFISEPQRKLVHELSRADLRGAGLANDWRYGNRMTIHSADSALELRRVEPTHQAERILLLAVEEYDPRPLAELNGRPLDPGVPPLNCLWLLVLYPDRLVDHENRQLTFVGGQTRSWVDTAGGIAVTRGRDLAAKGWGTAATMVAGLGPLGFHVRKRQGNSDRQPGAVPLVEGPDWAYAQPRFVPELSGELRRFAQQIDLTARRWRGQNETEPQLDTGGTDARSGAERLRELAALRDDGLLTTEEFEDQKRRLLEQGL